MTLQQEKFASYVHDGMTQLHEEHMYMAKKMDDIFAYNHAVYALQDTSPLPVPGLPFSWPPPSYYVAFPSAARAQDVPGSSGDGAGPSGVGTADPGDAGAGPSSVADDPME